MKTSGLAFLAPTPNLLPAEARENCAHIFLILGRMVGKVGNGLLNCPFHDLRSEGFIPKY